MKNFALPALALALLLLSACGQPTAAPPSEPLDPPPTPSGLCPDDPPIMPTPVPSDWTLTRCRIVDGAETGKLILAGEGPYDVYTLHVSDMVVTLDGGSSGPAELRDGMWVDVGHTGMILETFPAQFADARTVAGSTDGLDDRCGLYLRVLDDLWETGVAEIGVDLSGVTDLTESEKAAVAYAFGMAHGPILPLVGTQDELTEQGYITAGEGAPGLSQWENGALFTISGSADSGFEAQRWNGSAKLFQNCTAAQDEQGRWTYEAGSFAYACG